MPAHELLQAVDPEQVNSRPVADVVFDRLVHAFAPGHGPGATLSCRMPQ